MAADLQSLVFPNVVEAVAVEKVFTAESGERVDGDRVRGLALAVPVGARVGDVVGHDVAAVLE
jgi:hypothetical protein